jgi:hypothetical protein
MLLLLLCSWALFSFSFRSSMEIQKAQTQRHPLLNIKIPAERCSFDFCY